MTVDNRKNIEATYHQGLRCIHAETKYTQFKYGIRTNLGVRQDLQALDIHHAISSRRLGLLKTVLDSNSEWLLGLIVDQWEVPRGWTKEVRNDLEALAKLEVGVTPTPIQMIVQAKDTTKKIWRVRIKTAEAAAMLMQDTQDDFENLEKFQQSAFVSVGLKVGAPPVIADMGMPAMPEVLHQLASILPMFTYQGPTARFVCVSTIPKTKQSGTSRPPRNVT